MCIFYLRETITTMIHRIVNLQTCTRDKKMFILIYNLKYFFISLYLSLYVHEHHANCSIKKVIYSIGLCNKITTYAWQNQEANVQSLYCCSLLQCRNETKTEGNKLTLRIIAESSVGRNLLLLVSKIRHPCFLRHVSGKQRKMYL